MATFDTTKTELSKLLSGIVEGKLQLPDFQRGWVWDDEHIRSLLVSVARSFPIGAVMLLSTGGKVQFQMRPIEGVVLPPDSDKLAEELILDGQQRLTSLTQVLKLNKPVLTKDFKKKELKAYYYFNIEKALQGVDFLEDAVFAVDENKVLRSNFGRDIELDVSSMDKEIENFCFPCSQIFNSDAWEQDLSEKAPEKFSKYMKFRRQVIEPFRKYMLPIIRLEKETEKEAVCLVFEKVNTGGVPLSVFELVTATWAVEGFNLRDDWFGGVGVESRRARLGKRPLLREIQPTDFLQGICLLHSFEMRQEEIKFGKNAKESVGVSAKREHILRIPLSAYNAWKENLTKGFEGVDKFLRREGFYNSSFLPYRTQLIPLAVVLARLQERWLEPKIYEKLARWFWCGVFGELYGGAVETRIALDVQHLMAWILDSSAPEPATVQAAGFHPNRLDTMRTRTSAAYRGLYVLLQRAGAQDFFWKSNMIALDQDECKIDIHHIFPKKWCEEQGIKPSSYNSIVNKTAISYKANRMIGGEAPSIYLNKLQSHKQVQINQNQMDDILKSHLIDPIVMRQDNFWEFYKSRKEMLQTLIAQAMGKSLYDSSAEVLEEEDELEE